MAALPEESSVLTFEEARHLVESHAARLQPKDRELVELTDASGCVLAEAIHADRNFPPFARSARDGYAVQAADLQRPPATLDVVGEIKAGTLPADLPAVAPGQAAAIMTGASAPPGADAVVMVEYTSLEGKKVTVGQAVSAGANIVPAGAEARRGQRLLVPGMRLNDAAVGLAASVGKSHLLVHARPQVAVLATGDEIVDVDAHPSPSQIRNSNSYSLAVQIQRAGGEATLLPIAPDEKGRLRELIAEGLEADLLLLSGGVSMGRYDLVEPALAEMGAEFFITGVRIQPGKPLVFGRVRGAGSPTGKGTYFFGLPGNPVSTMVTFQLFVQPVIAALAGCTPEKLLFLHAKLRTEIKTKTGLTRFLPAVLLGEFAQAEVELVPWQGSGDIAATARANCYVVIPPDREKIAAGEWVPVLMR